MNYKTQKANKYEVFDMIKVIAEFHINHGNNFGQTEDAIAESIAKSLYPSVIKNSHLITKASNCLWSN